VADGLAEMGSHPRAGHDVCRIAALIYSCVFLFSPVACVMPLDIVSHKCNKQSGPHSWHHEEYLKRLDGRRIVFIGDSITRYQYLELAYYIVYGSCPDRTGERGYIISEMEFSSWPDFYKKSSDTLTVQNELFLSTELCVCTRLELSPGMTHEIRTFTYIDVEVRVAPLVLRI
jgi:hypothetical protein